MEAERAKVGAKKRGGAAALRALNLAKQEQDQAGTPSSLTDQELSPTLPKHEVWVELKSPRKRASTPDGADVLGRPLSPASSVSSSASERPLAQTVQVNGNGEATFTFSLKAPASAGTVTLYAAGNSANGDYNNTADGIASTKLDVTVTAAEMEAEKGGCAAAGGAPVWMFALLAAGVGLRRMRVAGR